MEIRVLRYFLTVVREESITKASEVLHITQPTLSRQLAQMEEDIGVKLFDRGTRKIKLTNEGILLRRRAEEILQLVDKTEKELVEQEEQVEGKISIGCGEIAAVQFLPKIIESFRQKYPRVTFDIFTATADLVKEQMDKEYFKILIEKYLDGNASTAEVKELCEWIKNNDSLDRWIMQAIERSDSHLDEEVYERLYTRIKENIESREKKSHRRFSFVPMLRWAAVVCLPIIAALAVYELGLDSKVDTLPLVVTAESGERAKVQLPDGTKVNINSASQISYPHDFNGKKRIVELDGEAYFEVTPDKERPFVVKAAGLEITVLGTAFDVCAYKDDSEVSVVLLTGKVDVASESDRYVMQPDEKLVYDRNTGTMQVGKVYSKEYVEWTDGNLRFENESLENIVKVLSRVYNVKIVFDSAFPEGQYFFTGSIGSGGITNALDILSMTSSLHYEVRDSVIVLHKK